MPRRKYTTVTTLVRRLTEPPVPRKYSAAYWIMRRRQKKKESEGNVTLIGTQIHNALDWAETISIDDKQLTEKDIKLFNLYSHLKELDEQGITSEMKITANVTGDEATTGVVDRIELTSEGDIKVIELKTHGGDAFPQGLLPRKFMHGKAAHMQVGFYSILIDELCNGVNETWEHNYKPSFNKANQTIPMVVAVALKIRATATFQAVYIAARNIVADKLSGRQIKPVVYHLPQADYYQVMNKGLDLITFTSHPLKYDRVQVVEQLKKAQSTQR
jgi:hypothetical protein